ncbi:hypothetical protein MRB53_014615 [Persea americana]|uniref:Uncharacterized protein n=1 Tax=Persea americana TaxID=3435 RepID=A0ACC2KBB2_PERAE|nr:hypothetical protein MRB53_014615 [Persea americana]
MAAASSSTPFFSIREEDQIQNKQQQQQQQNSTPTSSTAPSSTAPQKKKRNLPGTPNPDAEVIALSPKTLMATNRFICEVCNKGFQREQNLQLHRRGHNLPWKLRQKSTKEASRSTSAENRREKKWKCDKCSKRYAVQSDWKAHSKTCGTREYRCDCGTLFSRRDSFITHRAFCDALAQESVRLPSGLNTLGSQLYGNNNMSLGLSQVGSQISSIQGQNPPSTDLLRLGGSTGVSQFDHLIPPSNQSSFRPPHSAPSSAFFLPSSDQDFHEEPQSHHSVLQSKPSFHGLMQLPDLQNNPHNSSSATANLFNLGFFPNSSSSINNSNNADNNNQSNNHLPNTGLLIPDQFSNGNSSSEAAAMFSSNMIGNHMGSGVSSLYHPSMQNDTILPQMSATALLQKAAQMGASTSGNNILRGFGSSSSSNSAKQERPHISAGFKGNFSSGGDENLRSQLENESHFQDLLMNSLASGNSSMFGGGSAFGSGCTSGGHEQDTGYGGFGASRNLSNMAASDRLTRDFLGVGGMVRRTASQREQHHHGIDIGSLDSEMKSSPAMNQPFGGGNLQ